MKLIRVACRSLNDGFSYQLQKPQMIRAFSTLWGSADGNNRNQNNGHSESTDVFENRIFGGASEESSNSFFQKLEKVERAFGKSGLDSDNTSSILDGLHQSFNSLQDGMEGRLMDAASYFEWNPEEVDDDNYTFRADMNIHPHMTYETKDLDIRKPGVWKPKKRDEFTVTTKEVLRRADFRNVQFLANFLTEAGILIKRSQTGISAKAQRKVAREIKTARAFGLLPFTTMGTKAFQYGRTMESLDEDYDFDVYENPAMPDSEAPL
jgi:ribosomal protein S18